MEKYGNTTHQLKNHVQAERQNQMMKMQQTNQKLPNVAK